MAEGTNQVEEIAKDIREQKGLVIHVLWKIESQLEGVGGCVHALELR